MQRPSKKLFSIILAILVGAGVILFAWKGDALFKTDVSKTINGEWKDSLRVIPSESLSQILGNRNDGMFYTEGGSATTTKTDLLARNLITSYALVQGNMSTTTWSDADADALAKILAQQIELPRSTNYTTKDLNISEDNSPAALTAYSTATGRIIVYSVASQEKSDMEVAFAAPGANDIQRKADIDKAVARYKNLQKDLLAVKTPSRIAPLHLRLVQGYANIADSLNIMPEIFNDPVKGFSAFAQYKEEVEKLLVLSEEYREYIPKTQQ